MKLTCLLLIMASLALASCRSSKPEVGSSPSQHVLGQYLDAAKDPRRYWLNIYRDRSGHVFDNAFRKHETQHGRFAFRGGKRSPHLPLIEFNGRHAREVLGLIDTTAAHCYADLWNASLQQAIPLGLDNRPFVHTPMHVQENIEHYAAVVPQFRIGDLDFDSGIVYVRPQYRSLGQLARGLEGKKMPHIVLGNDVLRAMSFVQFDWEKREVTFASSAPYRPPEAYVRARLRLTQHRGALAVTGHFGNYEGPIIIDTAGDYELAVPAVDEEFVPELWLDTLRFADVQVVDSLDQDLTFRIPSVGLRLLSRQRLVLHFGARPAVAVFEGVPVEPEAGR